MSEKASKKSEEENASENSEDESGGIDMREFLESTPPGKPVKIKDLRKLDESKVNRAMAAYAGGVFPTAVSTPDIQLHCGSDLCGGIRSFSCSQNHPFSGNITNCFLYYQCRNCKTTAKTFSLALITPGVRDHAGTGTKYGEIPPFGPPTPSRLITLLRPDQEIFLKGRRSENQGLGIGAFGYYRRVVENQKNRLLDEIIRVAQRINAPQPTLDTLRAAQKETQFSKAMNMVKDSLPQSLLIQGHNPLTLLHDALSNGLHAQTDEECLAFATSIRVILEELAEKTAAALKDHAELKTALSRFLTRGQHDPAQ